MRVLQHYIMDEWCTPDGSTQTLTNAIDGAPLFEISTQGVDFNSVFQHARAFGGCALRKMTFHERGRMLKALALFLNEKKISLLRIKLLHRCHQNRFMD